MEELTKDIFNNLKVGDQIIYTGNEIGCEGDEFIFAPLIFRVNRRYKSSEYYSTYNYPVVELYVQEGENFILSLLIKWDDQSDSVVIFDHGSPIQQPFAVYEEALYSNRLTIREPKIPNPA